MHFFRYRGKNLYAEGTSVTRIAREVGTPVYIYSKKTLKRHYRAFTTAFSEVPSLVCYSVKANSNLAVLKVFVDEGGGFDIVSGGELYRALRAGAHPRRIVFSGVGKTREEIEYAIKKNILMFNVESAGELRMINRVARGLGKKAGAAIRVNPNVDPKTHPYISTGLKKNKFGMEPAEALRQFAYAKARLKNLTLMGVDCHIGSQITELSPFIDALKKTKSLITKLRKEGIDIKYLDVGGGLGITYENEEAPHPSSYGEAVISQTRSLGVTLVFEPGRSIAGNAGILVARVLYTKKGTKKNFIIVDAAMNDLLRPALYGSYHAIQPVRKGAAGDEIIADVVGPICESVDFLAQGRKIAPMKEGDLIACMSAGAYGFSMASNYNSRARAAEVMVDGTAFHVIRKREGLKDLVRGESIPAPNPKEPGARARR